MQTLTGDVSSRPSCSAQSLASLHSLLRSYRPPRMKPVCMPALIYQAQSQSNMCSSRVGPRKDIVSQEVSHPHSSRLLPIALHCRNHTTANTLQQHHCNDTSIAPLRLCLHVLHCVAFSSRQHPSRPRLVWSWETSHPPPGRRFIQTLTSGVSSRLAWETSHPHSLTGDVSSRLSRDFSRLSRETPHPDSHRRRLSPRPLREASLTQTLTGGVSSRFSRVSSRRSWETSHPHTHPQMKTVCMPALIYQAQSQSNMCYSRVGPRRDIDACYVLLPMKT